MKTIPKLLVAAALAGGNIFSAHSQSFMPFVDQNPYKFQVTTRLVEKTGAYNHRLIYRELLTEYMKSCPYIGHFKIQESANDGDSVVFWTYQVNRWSNITEFYNWMFVQLKNSNEKMLEKLLKPFASNYAIGGKIHVEKRITSALARE